MHLNERPLRRGITLLFLLASFFLPLSAFALEIPEKPQAHVNDYAHLLSGNAYSQLESVLADFEKATSTQIAVAIFPSLEGEALEDFSMRLAEKWKIGSKKNSNGIILLIFRDDHAVRIEVGYGLEGALPDAIADQIIRHQIAPAFREGDFDKGVSDAVQAIIAATRGEYKAPNVLDEGLIKKYSWLIYIILILYIVAPYIGYLVLVAACGMIFGVPVGLAVGMGLMALLAVLRQIFSSASIGKTYSSRGGYWGSSSGGGFSGGGFGGGFSGGGGSFGGGGASGGW